MKTLLTLFFIYQILTVSGQSYRNGDILYVISENGLNLRTEKNIDSDVLKILSRGQKVKVVGYDSLIQSTTISGVKGKWLKVSSLNDSDLGFVFDAYLSILPPFKFVKSAKDTCWTNDILLDMATSIGKIDSFEYYNYSGGEGSYTMRYFKLNNSAKYIEHNHWEHMENELQLNNLSRQQIYQYVHSILIYCKKEKINIDQNYFEKNRYLSIHLQEDCCAHSFRIYSEGNNLVINIQTDGGS